MESADKYSEINILIVDDAKYSLRLLEIFLSSMGIKNYTSCCDSREVIPLLEKKKFSIVLLDLNMPYIPGEELLAYINENFPEIIVMVITSKEELDHVVRCMRMGAFDYMTKPVEDCRFSTSLNNAIRTVELRNENTLLKKNILEDKLFVSENFDHIVTQNDKMLSIFSYIESIAASSQPVMVVGETGTGKDLVARAIHKASAVKKDLVSVNVAGLDDNVFSDTLFGHVRGAFTSADQNRPGLIEKAENGTIFLDEIGDLSSASQVKLLRLLQEKEYYPLGSDTLKKTNARVLVATNRNIESLLNSGKFRKDLYYRLRTHLIIIPPLRERLDDLPLLVDFFMEEAVSELNINKPVLSKKMLAYFASYHFPGNIRELRAIIFEAASRSQSQRLSLSIFEQLMDHEIPDSIQDEISTMTGAKIQFGPQLPTLKEVSQSLVEEAFQRAGKNQKIAAKMLGISQQALSKRLQKYK